MILAVCLIFSVDYISYLGNRKDSHLNANEERVPFQSLVQWPRPSLGTLIGKEVNELYKWLGYPHRMEPSAYGYTWFIYNMDINNYVQVGVLDGKIVTVYAIGDGVNMAPFEIGKPSHLINSSLYQQELSWKGENGVYEFQLKEKDWQTQPLIKVNHIFAQIYIDQFTGLVSSVRFSDGETLVKHRCYEMRYTGELIVATEPNKKEWERIEAGVTHQIFDITNIVRNRYGRESLEWNDRLASVAYFHSKDMAEASYFSHTSKMFGSLEDRLNDGNIHYLRAGENIAAYYSDGPAVVEGWLNSEGHRESLLNDEFTHIGVGVFQKLYTQNFIGELERE